MGGWDHLRVLPAMVECCRDKADARGRVLSRLFMHVLSYRCQIPLLPIPQALSVQRFAFRSTGLRIMSGPEPLGQLPKWHWTPGVWFVCLETLIAI